MSCSGDQQNETGFTLIEILIATMLTAVILTVLTASFLVFFSNASYTSGRDDHAAGAEALSSWLDRDLASATIDNPPVVKPASSCAASPVMLSLSWTQYAAGSQPDAPPDQDGNRVQGGIRLHDRQLELHALHDHPHGVLGRRPCSPNEAEHTHADA